MNGKLFLIMGIPGAGKSTWCKNNIKDEDCYISRDEIRFSMLGEEDEYFDNEKEVFKEFCKQIKENIEAGKNVYADATHLTMNARSKTINGIKTKPSEINVIYIKVPLEIALKRNAQREGLEKIPQDVIKGMAKAIEIDLNDYRIKSFLIINNWETYK